eukprot:3616333-Lingulodinium_polyedra.AAC.1
MPQPSTIVSELGLLATPTPERSTMVSEVGPWATAMPLRPLIVVGVGGRWLRPHHNCQRPLQ